MINLVKLNWLGLWFNTCPSLPYSENMKLQQELEDIKALLDD